MTLLQMSERSLIEVKHLTEYEDEKANRILTAIAFLSALAGVLYVGLLQGNRTAGILTVTKDSWVILYHLVFGIYCLMTILGALLVINSVRPRFNVPKGWEASQKSNKAKVESFKIPSSFLFFEKILAVKPREWASAFTKQTISDIQTQYIKNYIHESYLVADKIRIKLKTLQAGMWLLQIAVLALAFWILIFGWIIFTRLI
jgi:hypothetical protein